MIRNARGTHLHRVIKTHRKRVLACMLATALLGTAALPDTANAAEKETIGNGVSPSCDEAYYAMLDYYGNLTDGSVVKSYRLNGATTLTDYGTYDSVNNLTDGTEPVISDGKTTFQFGEDAPENFYFEAKTKTPFKKLPWTISMSYTLNGVPTKAEDLAGKTGVVEINMDFLPNEKAGTYAKNNYTLEAMAIFNQDEILSLEAEGGQVQLIGNMRVVLFVCLPGEENHFTIRVGSEDFSFGGMTYLMVPATLSQLDMLSDLSDDKDDIEKNYKKLNNSLDILLDAMGDMTGSLNASADGLDQLNEAREGIASGSDQIYDDIDLTIGDLTRLAEQLKPAKDHLETAEDALDHITDDVNVLLDQAVSLQTELTSLKTILEKMDNHLGDLRYGSDGNLRDLRSDLKHLGSASDQLQVSLRSMRSKLRDMESAIGDLEGDTEVTVNGKTVSEIRTAASQAQTLHSAYVLKMTQEILAANPGMTEEDAKKQVTDAGFESFISAYLMQQGVPAATAEAQAKQLAEIYAMDQSGALDAQLEQADAVNSLLASTNLTVSQFKNLMNGFLPDTTSMLGQLADLCNAIGSGGLSGTMVDLLDYGDDLLDDMSDLSHVARDAIDKLDLSLSLLDQLNQTVNSYIPETRQVLSEARGLTDTMTASLEHLTDFLKDLKDLMKKNDGDLNEGTKKSLSGLASTLRQMSDSLHATDDIKSAKGDISDIIEELWNDHTGDSDLLLNMDPNASPRSLTSSKNDHPSSVQVLIRSQEIKVDEAEIAAAEQAAAAKTGFFDRIAQMFRDMWSFVKGLFS